MLDLSNIPTDRLHEIDFVEIPGIYQASPWGKECHRLRVDEALVAGAAGTGKSLWGLHDAMPVVVVANELCKRGIVKWGTLADDQCLHLRRKTAGLDTTIRRAAPVFKAIDPNVRFREKTMTFVFSSGLQFVFGHCKDPDSWENYYTHSYVHIFFDEMTQFTDTQYQQICSRNRATNPVLRRMACVRGASNPGPGWVRDVFVDPAPSGRKLMRQKLDNGDYVTRIYIPATIDDNPDKGFVEQYKKKLLGRPEHIKRALLYGDWWVTADSYFAEHWRPDLHVIPPFRIPGDWPRFRSLDWGYKSYGCVHWWAVDPDGNLICEREYSFRFKDGDEVAMEIRRIEEKMGLWHGRRSKITGPADTNLWGEVSSADSHAERMARHGVIWTKADKRSRKMNAERVLARLDSHGGGMQRPGICFFAGLTDNIVKTLPTIPADNDNLDPEKRDTPLKCDTDHWYDSVAYACIASNTPVTTGRGDVPVKDLRDDDLVLSTDGRWYPCAGGFKTGVSRDVVNVMLSNGQTMVATPDHRILTTKGIWKRIDAMDESDCAFAPLRSFARQNAQQSTGENRESMTLSEFALPAGSLSWEHGSRTSRPVLGSAVKVLSVSPAGKADVYCTTVPVMGAFVACGVVVSNCAYRTADGESMRRRIENRRQSHMDDEDGPKRRKRDKGGWGSGYGAEY